MGAHKNALQAQIARNLGVSRQAVHKGLATGNLTNKYALEALRIHRERQAQKGFALQFTILIPN